MDRDPQMLMSIQIALIGIVIVAGFFYLWRSLSRIENKIEELSCQMVNSVCLSKQGYMPTDSLACQNKPVQVQAEPIAKVMAEAAEAEADEEDDFSIMKACFGDIPIESLMDEAEATLMIFNQEPLPQEDKGAVVLEEIPEKQAEEVASIAETDSNEFSKTKLRKMPVDALKEICMSRGLSADGTKNILIDRILASVPA